MATTNFYGWAEPDNTSLVKNGAQDIRILGDAIDASVWNIGFGQAGKNKIINGNFGIWQRGTSFNAATSAYTADRWSTLTDKTGASVLTTQQAFTAGAAPVAGYESQYFLRTVFPAGGTYCIQEQRVEDVRTFAGQTVTLSFWAKASATVTIAPTIVQSFGSGGSADVETTTSNQILTTSWARYSVTAAIPSITGKTIGAGNYLSVRAMRAVTASGFTIDIWGVQLEYGSKATPFQTASGGSPQAELAMCQRYYIRTLSNQLSSNYGLGLGNSATQTYFQVSISEMRTSPTVIDYSALEASDGSASVAFTSLVINSGNSTARVAFLIGSHSSGITQYRPYLLRNNASTSGYLGLGAEL
jgi:hypothetical protein